MLTVLLIAYKIPYILNEFLRWVGVAGFGRLLDNFPDFVEEVHGLNLKFFNDYGSLPYLIIQSFADLVQPGLLQLVEDFEEHEQNVLKWDLLKTSLSTFVRRKNIESRL